MAAICTILAHHPMDDYVGQQQLLLKNHLHHIERNPKLLSKKMFKILLLNVETIFNVNIISPQSIDDCSDLLVSNPKRQMFDPIEAHLY